MAGTCAAVCYATLASGDLSMIPSRQSGRSPFSEALSGGPNNSFNETECGDSMNKHFDMGSLVIILTTLLLFVVALFVKGLTKDLLLEAGVLLVSIKLIVMAYKNSVISNQITGDLAEIKKMIAAGNEVGLK